MRVDPRFNVEVTQVQDRLRSERGTASEAPQTLPRARVDVALLTRGVKSSLVWSRTRFTRPLTPSLDPDGLSLSEAWLKVRQRLEGGASPGEGRPGLLGDDATGGGDGRDGTEGRMLAFWDQFLALLLGRDYLRLRTPERLARARSLATQGKHKEALGWLSRILAVEPDQAEAHAHKGRILLDEGRHDEAERHLQHAASMRPRAYGVQMDLGELYYRMNEPQLARHAFAEAARLHERHADPHAWLGVMAYEGDRLPEAAEALERAVQLDPSNAVARFYLAQVAFQLNDPLRARFQLAMVERLEPAADLARFDQATLALAAPSVTTAPLRQHRWQTPGAQGA